MIFVPFLVVLIPLKTRAAAYLAAALFVTGAATDGLDGYLARRYGASSRTGQWLDPLADKILVVGPVVLLTALGRFPLWAAVVIIAREAGVSLLRVVLGLRGRPLPASQAAKLKTTFQLLAITLYILPLGSEADGSRLTILIVAVALTVLTGVLYAIQAVGWLSNPDPAQTAGTEPLE
jgi:CDP-diacylglycerol---glycerol-3-phosphate 3-phosphatidyltransferase